MDGGDQLRYEIMEAPRDGASGRTAYLVIFISIYMYYVQAHESLDQRQIGAVSVICLIGSTAACIARQRREKLAYL